MYGVKGTMRLKDIFQILFERVSKCYKHIGYDLQKTIVFISNQCTIST